MMDVGWERMVAGIIRSTYGGGAPPPSIDEPEKGDDDDGMLERIQKLEESMNQVKIDLAVLSSEVSSFRTEAFRAFATKEDLANLHVGLQKDIRSQTWLIIVVVVLAQALPAIPAILRGFHLIT